MIQSPINRTTLSTGGDTITIDVTTTNVREFVYTGSGTMSASTTISPAAIAMSGVTYNLKIRYNATFILDGNSITIFGKTLSQEEASGGNTIFDCSYIGGAWTVCVIDSATIQPKGVDGVKVTTLDGSGGTVTLIPNVDYQTQELVGSGTLIGNYVYTGTGNQNGDKFRIIYNGTFAATGSNITIFGYTLTDAEALNGGVVVDAEYNGSSWTTSAYNNPFVSSQVDMIPITLSFEASEQTMNIIPMGYKGYLYQLEFQVIKDIAGTDNATVAVDINGTPIGGYPTLTITAGTTVGTGTVYPVTSPNTFNAGNYINFTCVKTTAGGVIRMILYVVR